MGLKKSPVISNSLFFFFTSNSIGIVFFIFKNCFITLVCFCRALSSVSVKMDILEASVKSLMPATADRVATMGPALTSDKDLTDVTSLAPAPVVCF